MNKKIIVVLAVIFVLVVAFIWGNSVLPPDTSGRISEAVGKLLSSVIGSGDASTTVGGVSVRKMGHFCEFFALGVTAWFLLRMIVKDRLSRALVTVVLGLFIPLMDETIQIFSGRGHSVSDVWIDICGFAVGSAIALLATFIVLTVLKRVKNKHK